MRKKWLGLIGLLVLAAPSIRAQMTAVSASVQDANGQHYVNCSWSVVFVGQNTIPGAGPYQPQALLVGQQGECDSSGNLRVTLADNVNTITPTPSQWNFSICSAPGYVPGGTFCRSNMLVTVTGQAQDLTAFFQPLMPLLPPGGGGGGGTQYITDATPLMGLMRTGTTLGLQTTCVAGQYLGWNGSAWACTGAGVGGGTTVTVNGTAAIPNILNFNNTSPLPPAGSQNVTFQLNGNSVSAYVPAGGGGGAGILVNGTTPSGTVNFNASTPLPPPNGINVNWTLAGTNLTGAIVGNGNPNSCLIGTGIFAACPGGGGGGGGTPLPTTAQYDLFASTGAGGAQASGVLGGSGFLRGQVFTATGDVTSHPAPFQLFPNASVEYFPTGYTWSGGTAGATNGFALYMSHSGGSTSANNGGVGLGGGNSSSTGNQLYLDCEIAGCDFKVQPTYNGAAIGGGGGSLPTTPAWDLFASTGSGGAQASGVLGQRGFLRAYVLEATGTGNASPFSVPNGSIEYFPTGGYGVGGPNGIAIHFSHSSVSGQAGNGGIALGGGNSSGTNYQIYLDCEQATGCDFKVPVSYLGSSLGGGGAAGVSSINGTAGAFNFTGAGVSCATTTCTFTGGGGGVGNPILVDPGTTLAATNTGQGGFGIATGGNPQISRNGSGWIPLVSVANVNGPITTPQVTFSNTAAPTAVPANGTRILFAIQGQNPQNTNALAYLPGSGNTTDCLIGTGGFAPCPGGGGGGSGTVNSGTGGHFTWYPTAGTTVASNANLDDDLTTPSTITSQEPIAAPQINVNGAVGTGIAMTGAGGTLPAVTTGSGGVGIGPGGIPEYNPNGTGWVAIGSGGGGGVSSINTVPGAFTFTGAGVSCASTTCTFPGGGGGGSGSVSANFGNNSLLAYYPPPWTVSTFYPTNWVIRDSNGNLQRATPGGNGGTGAQPTWPTTLNATITDNQVTWTLIQLGNGTTTVTPAPVVAANANGIFLNGAVQFGALGIGAAPDVALGRISPGVLASTNGGLGNTQGYMKTGGLCTITSPIAVSTRGNLCPRALPNYATGWIVRCVIPFNFTGGSGTTSVIVGLNLQFTPVSGTYFSTVLWGPGASGGPVFGTALVSATGDTALITTAGLSLSDTTSIYTAYLDGVINAPTPAGQLQAYVALTGGTTPTAQIREGTYCMVQ